MSTTLTVNGRRVDRLPDDIAQPVALDPALQEKLVEYISRNIDDPDYIKFVEGGNVAKREDAGTALTSPAARRAAQIQEHATAPARATVKRVDIEGEAEPFYIRVFDFKTVMRHEFLNNRLPDGRLDLSDEQKIEAWLTSVLLCGVVRGADDLRPFFQLKRNDNEPMASASEWVQSIDPQIRSTAQRLQQEIVFLNLDFFNPEVAEETRAALEAAGVDLDALDPREKKESSPPSSTPLNSTPIGGYGSTDTTTAPASSPTGAAELTEYSATITAMSG